jgi:hypothetical protein
MASRRLRWNAEYDGRLSVLVFSSPAELDWETRGSAACVTVSFRDCRSMRHSVEDTADSLFEVAVLGIGNFRSAA